MLSMTKIGIDDVTVALTQLNFNWRKTNFNEPQNQLRLLFQSIFNVCARACALTNLVIF